MDFALFILLNAVLFIRPAEVVPALEGLPLYEGIIVACLLASARGVAAKLTPRSLAGNPVTACVLGLLGAVVLSHLSHLELWGVQTAGVGFAKVLVYYLLAVSTLNTPARLRRFLFWLVGFITVAVVLALLQYHQVIDLPALSVLEEREVDEETGEVMITPRLRSTGIFQDPNDLSLILVMGMLLCLHWLTDRRRRLPRVSWLVPLAVFGYALALTQSRGGFLGLLAGVLILLQAHYGWRKTLLLAACGLPVLFGLFAGRQTSLSTSEGTSQERIQLWSQGLDLLREAPLFGIGAGQFADRAGLVAHNSFVHSYAELGLLGGTLFFGAFYLSVRTLWGINGRRRLVDDEGLRRLAPYLTAIVGAFAVGLLSLSRVYAVPTYLTLGLGVAFARLVLARAPLPVPRLGPRLVGQLAVGSSLCLAGIYLFVRTFAHWG